MSGTSTSKQVMGLTATAVMALTMLSSTGAQAAGGDSPAAAEAAINHLQGQGSSGTRSLRAVEASECTFAGYTPNKIVLGARPIKRTFDVAVTDCEPAGWGLGLYPFFDRADSNAGWASTLAPKISLDPHSLVNADAGKHANVVVAAYGLNDDIDDPNLVPAGGDGLALSLLRASTFGGTFNASEPVKKGGAIKVKGTLGRVNWNGAKTLKYVGFPKAKIHIRFRVKSTDYFKTVKIVRAGEGGKISTTVKATQSGEWQLAFGGLSTTSSSSSNTDLVKVSD